ncbi:Vacuolar amino acid transporter 2, partial [Globisporangium splendens]
MNGGLSVPNIRTELMTMSATAVSRWAITTSHIDQVIGEILLHNTRASSTYITPLDATPRRPLQLRDNMWTTGAALCTSLHSRLYEPRERDNVRWCYEHFKSTIVQTQWDGDVFQIDLSSKMSDRLPGIIAEGRKLRGTFCAEWLPYMTSTADGWLLDSNGSPYKLAHTSLSVGTAQLGDILRWEWIRPGVLNFIPTCGISGFSRPSIRALERLCATLVSNFPQLLYRPQQTNVLRLYNGQRHYNHEWHLHTSEATLTHIDTTLVKATHTVHSAMDCDVMATRDLNGQKVSFHAHPRFTRIVQLWGGNGRYNTPDLSIGNKLQQRGHKLAKILEMQQSTKLSIQQDLWITVYTVQTLLRLKANRLSMWNYEKADLSCSNPECSQVVQSSVQHLFWECPKAKLVWNYFCALWAKIGIAPGHDPAIWIFSLDLPDTPRHAWTTIKRHIIGHKFSNEHLQDHLYSVAHMLWRYMSASLIQAIWCAHLRRMDSDPIESTAEMAIMMTRLEAGMRNLTRLAEAQAGDSDGHTVAAVLKAYVDCFLSQTDALPLTPSDTRGVYLLFFDGGSRGNPGPGGTGSIIVRVHKNSRTASLIWAASMAYSRKDTTNNFAEHWGLIHGLREAQRSHFEPLYVIGDSALITSQQRMHRSPRQHRLARLYQTSRRLADCIDIRGWYHHYRAFNKMADSAANLAMDTRTSTQVHFPTQRAAFNNLTQDLDNDVMHWLVRSSEDPRSLDNTRQPHTGPREHAILVKDYLAMKFAMKIRIKSEVAVALYLLQVDRALTTAHVQLSVEIATLQVELPRALSRRDPMGKSVRKYRKNRDYEYIDPNTASAYYADGKGSEHTARSVIDHNLLASPRHFISLGELAQGESSPLQVVMLLVAASVGPTVLVMPYVFLQGGFVMTVFMVLFVGIASYWASSCLICLGVDHGIYSFQGLAQLAFGFRGAFVVAVAQFLVSLGLILTYLTIIFQDLPVLLGHALHLDFDANGWPMETDNRLASKILSDRTLFAELAAFTVVIPMCLFLYSYRKIQNWTAVMTFLLVIASLCAVGKARFYYDSNASTASQGFSRDYVAVPSTLFQAFGILSTQLVCQHHTFHAFYALRNRSNALFTRVSLFASLLVLYLAYSFGIGGEPIDAAILAFRARVRRDLHPDGGKEFTIVFFSYLIKSSSNSVFVQVISSRFTVLQLTRATADHDLSPEEVLFRAQLEAKQYVTTGGSDPNTSSSQHKTVQGGGDVLYTRVHVAITFVVLVLLVQIVALSSPLDLGSVLSVTGGLAGITLIFVFPAACYLKLPVSDDRRVGEIATRRVYTKCVPWASIVVGIVAVIACIIANMA